VVVPVVLVVDLFFYVTILVIAANQDIAVIAIVGYDLVQIAVRTFHDGQLRVAARQSQRGHKQEGQHRNPSGHPAHQVVESRIGQHVGVPSLIEPPAWWRTRLRSWAVRSESVCVDASAGILLMTGVRAEFPGSSRHPFRVTLYVRYRPRRNWFPYPVGRAEAQNRNTGAPDLPRPDDRNLGFDRPDSRGSCVR